MKGWMQQHASGTPVLYKWEARQKNYLEFIGQLAWSTYPSRNKRDPGLLRREAILESCPLVFIHMQGHVCTCTNTQTHTRKDIGIRFDFRNETTLLFPRDILKKKLHKIVHH